MLSTTKKTPPVLVKYTTVDSSHSNLSGCFSTTKTELSQKTVRSCSLSLKCEKSGTEFRFPHTNLSYSCYCILICFFEIENRTILFLLPYFKISFSWFHFLMCPKKIHVHTFIYWLKYSYNPVLTKLESTSYWELSKFMQIPGRGYARLISSIHVQLFLK